MAETNPSNDTSHEADSISERFKISSRRLPILARGIKHNASATTSTVPSMPNPAKREQLLATISETPLASLGKLQLHTCQHCKNIMIDPKSSFWIHTLPYTIDQCLEAAHSGCVWYTILLGFVRRSRKPAEDLDRDGFFFEMKYRDSSHLGSPMWDILSLTVKTGTKYYSWPCLAFDVFSEASDPSALSITSRPLNRHVSSEIAFAKARNWLAECDSHPRCQASTSDFLPNRVLDVDIPRAQSIIRLVPTTATFPAARRYVALSYCWGGPQPVTTTASTLSAHQSQIAIKTLPQTLKDAISVTRRIGFRYLWVDSLCIIQDSPTDMSLEIALMPEYYSHAVFTLCAASSPSSTSGFLNSRPWIPYLNGPFSLRYKCPNDQIGHITLVQHKPFSIEEEVINTRGWTLQESLLSTRLLTFGSRNLRWSCRTSQYSDGGPWDACYDSGLREKWEALHNLDERWSLSANSDPLIGGWRHIVENYCRRRMSVPGDKLAALSGIARRYYEAIEKVNMHRQCFTRCLYLAGLWEVDLIRALFWNTNTYLQYLKRDAPPTQVQELERDKFGVEFEEMGLVNVESETTASETARTKRVKRYRAPSWSWACIEGEIGHRDWALGLIPSDEDWRNFRIDPRMEEVWRERATIDNAEIEPSLKEAPFGTLKSAVLSLKARVLVLNEEDEKYFMLVPDTDKDKEALRNAISKGKCTLLQLTSVEVIKYKFMPRARGLIIVENVAGAKEYRRIGIFIYIGGWGVAPFKTAKSEIIRLI